MATTTPPFKYRPRKKRPAQTYKQYRRRWEVEGYRHLVIGEAARIGSDGCSGVPDFYLIVCREHDIHYATHKDFFTDAPLTKEDADRYLKWGIQFHSSLGRQSPMALWRYWALSRKKGLGLGSRAWDTGPERMKEFIAPVGARRDPLTGRLFWAGEDCMGA